MLKAPKFWYLKKDTYLSNSLYPFSLFFRLGTKLRSILSQKKKSELPIICVGNIVVGGAGKTPVALKIGKMLRKAGYSPHFVSKGYSGIEKDNTLEVKNQKLGRKARFKALLLDKNFEPENPKKLEELTDKTCRYPIGHPSEESSFYFCGRKPFEKEVYCRLHLMLCFQPKNVKEEDVVSEDDLPVYEKKIKSA